jgi:hypothetical protein
MKIHTDETYLQHREMFVIVDGKATVCYIAERRMESTNET